MEKIEVALEEGRAFDVVIPFGEILQLPSVVIPDGQVIRARSGGMVSARTEGPCQPYERVKIFSENGDMVAIGLSLPGVKVKPERIL